MYEKTCEHSAVAVLSGVCVHWIWQRGYFGAAGLREERKDEKKEIIAGRTKWKPIIPGMPREPTTYFLMVKS